MSVKNFKFVSPGVFINEIDNSFIPRTPDNIGPVIVGRARKGLANVPTKIESYSDFVNMFGDTVPGSGGGDVYRDGNLQSPMYGTYAAKAFLHSGVAPLTYVRLLGEQSTSKKNTAAAKAGWQTVNSPKSGGGAYGLFLIKSSSVTGDTRGNLGNLDCAAIWYLNNGSIKLSGTVWGTTAVTASAGTLITSDANGVFKMTVNGTAQGTETFTFNFDDNSQNFIRNQFNTNPQLIGSGSYYPASAEVDYWLGETFEQNMRDNGAVGTQAVGIIMAIGSGSATNPQVGPMKMKGQAHREGVAGWFIAQDTGIASDYTPSKVQKLFRLVGRGHGEWLPKHVKISIENIRISNTTTSEYGTFSVVLRNINDTDNNVQVIERFDNCSMDPKSPDFVARKIGDRYHKWDSTNRRLRQYGEYDNRSNFIYVEMNPDAEAGATDPALLPFGYYGPPQLKTRAGVKPSGTSRPGLMIQNTSSLAGYARPNSYAKTKILFTQGVNAGAATSKVSMVSGTTAPALLFKSTPSTLGAPASVYTTVLTDSNGTVRNYKIVNTGSSGAKVNSGTKVIAYLTGTATVSALASLKTAIESANGHNGSIICSLAGTPPAQQTLSLRNRNSGGGSAITYVSGTSPDGWMSGSKPYARAELIQWGYGPASSVSVRASGLSGGLNKAGTGPSFTASLGFPSGPLRLSASDGGLTDPTDAYFGMRTTRTADSSQNCYGVFDRNRLWWSGFPDDPTTSATQGEGTKSWQYIFSLDNVRANSDKSSYYYQSGSRASGNSVSAGTGSYKTLLDAGYNRFTAPVWGAFDGFDITKPDPLANSLMSSGDTEDTNYVYHTYRRALETLADPELLDFNLLSTPGLTNNSLTSYSISLCEDRADAMALIDLANVYTPPHETYKAKDKRANRNVTNIANSLKDRRIDSSYGATFYPWVQTRDATTGQLVWIPPTVAMAGVLGSAEAKTAVWFAPAGFNRGGLSDGAAGIPITNVTSRLSSKERDTLYENRINPIASFPSSGIVVFGQKTLQERQSALDRVNVRRLVIYLKKQISVLSTQILFEQNVQATWNRFKALIEPFLANVKTRYGITEYRLILDESTTTPDLIDQNIMYAKIMIKPARAIEFIAIDFVIASTGASFDD